MGNINALNEKMNMISSTQKLEKNDKEIFEVALLAGTLLMKAGAETYRVENTVTRILDRSEQVEAEAIAMMTALYVTLKTTDQEYVTAIKRIPISGRDLAVIQKVNAVSRDFTSGKITTATALQQLKQIELEKRSKWIFFIFSVIVGPFFVMMSNGTPLEFLVSAIAGTGSVLAQLIFTEKRFGNFIPSILSALVATFIIGFLDLHFSPQINGARVITSSLAILYPGIMLCNGIQDMMQGDIITGIGNLVQAAITAAAVACGAAMGLLLSGVNYL